MLKFVLFLILCQILLSSCSLIALNETVLFKVNIDKMCEVEIEHVSGSSVTIGILEMRAVLLKRFVKDTRNVDIDLVKSKLPNIDFDKKILSIDDAQQIKLIEAELGPWSSERKIYLGNNEIVECSFSKTGVLIDTTSKVLPKSFAVVYEVVNEN